MYVYARMYVRAYARMYIRTYVRMYIYVRTYVRTYVRMYVCTYVGMCIHKISDGPRAIGEDCDGIWEGLASGSSVRNVGIIRRLDASKFLRRCRNGCLDHAESGDVAGGFSVLVNDRPY